MPILTQAEGVRLYKNKEIVINTYRGTLLTAAPCYYDVANWTPTFTQDFDDVATAVVKSTHVGAYTANTFYSKGTAYDIGGVSSLVENDYDIGVSPNTLYYQSAASIISLGAGQFSGDALQGSVCAHLETQRRKVGASDHTPEDGVTSIAEGFEQCYGMWELRAKLPGNFRPDIAIMWPSFWLYSNRYDNPEKPPVELDIFEIYQSSVDNVTRGDGSWHESMHTHDTPHTMLAPGYISRDYASSNIMTMNPNATFGAASNFDWGDAYHLFQLIITPEWLVVACDGIEITRHGALDAYHQPLNTLVSAWVNAAIASATSAKLVQNGTFATDVSWTKGVGWTISGGAAHATAAADTTTLSQAKVLVAGTPYPYTYTVSNYVAGGVRIKLTGGTPVVGTTRTANGTYTETLTADVGNNTLTFEAVGTTTLDVDTVTGIGNSGFVTDVPVWMDVDWVKCWQNPDWDNRTIGGTADVLTVTTGLTWASYASKDGHIINGTASLANLTTTPTLNASGNGGKVVKKYSDFANNPPWTGSLIPLDIGDITTAGRHNFKNDNANNCWILLNPGNPFTDNFCYVPPAYTVPQIAVDVAEVESRIMRQWNKTNLLPDDHVGKTSLTFDTNVVQPRCVPNRSYRIVETKEPGTLVGTCAIANIPGTPARASWSGSSNFIVNPANGSIYVAAAAAQPLPISTVTGEVSFWSQGIPSAPGANVCTVTIDIIADQPFSIPLYFGANVAMLYEFDTPSQMSTDLVTDIINGGKIAQILDSSGHNRTGTQTTDANRPTYDAAGFNGFGCALSTSIAGSGLWLNLPAAVFQSPLNAMDGLSFFNDGTAGISPNNVFRHSDPYTYTVPHSVYFSWSPVEVLCWVNGTSIPVAAVAGTIPTSGWIIFCGQTDLPAATAASVFGQNESDGRLFQTVSGGAKWKGKAGLLGAGTVPINNADRDKLIGHVHWRFGLQSLLPVGFAYKTQPPTLYG